TEAKPATLAAPPRTVPAIPDGPPPAAPTPTITRRPTPAFQVTQATKAAQATAAVTRPSLQDCENCGAKVPPDVKRCRCGFEVSQSASQIPSLSMSPEERAAFRAALAPRRTDKT